MSRAVSAPLILASNQPPAEVPAPRTDFVLLTQTLGDATLLCTSAKGSRAHSDLRQAIMAVRRQSRVSIYVSLSEKIGLPLALLLAARRIETPHVLVAHHLTSPKKRALQSRLPWLQRLTRIVVLSEPQAAYLRDTIGYPETQTTLLPHSVDTDFWCPQGKLSSGEPFVLSVGQERRDYGTLLAAARALPMLRFVVVAGSAWANRKAIGESLPPNVTIRQNLSYTDLRNLYARAALVVLPLEADVRSAAGATALREAMAMEKAVIRTETPGLSGYGRPNEDSYLVPPSNPGALADAIRQLQKFPVDAARLGMEARRTAARHSLEIYVAALAQIVRDAEGER